jgi:hypothetical protein
MDIEAQRKARRAAIKADLRHAYHDDEASPPEWVDLLERARSGAKAVRDKAAAETQAFVSEPDIKKALARRERMSAKLRQEIENLNKTIRRLNLVAPNARFTRGELDADEILQPLFRSNRNPRG